MSQAQYAREIVLSDCRIMRMTEHDLIEVVEIEETSGLSCWGWEAYQDELVNGLGGLMLVARHRDARWRGVDGAELAGFVASRLIADELHINNIAVRAEFRQQGIGSALLRAVCHAGAATYHARSALLEVRATNLAAQSLYERHGFRTAGRRVNYYSQPPEDALVMQATF